MIISLILVVLAAIANACMDNLSHHWYKSIFNKLNSKFWNPEISWKLGYIPHTKYKFDAWHIFKSTMIICLCAAIALYNPEWLFPGNRKYSCFIAFCLFGIAWNGTFNLFYNHILNRKTK